MILLWIRYGSPSESEEDGNTTEDIAAIIQHLQEDEDEEEMVNHEVAVTEQDFTKHLHSQASLFILVDDDVLDHIVCETNRYAEQVISGTRTLRHSRLNMWVPTCNAEMKKFLGLLMWMSLNRRSIIQSYWSIKPIYQNAIPANTMSRNRFELLLLIIHFSDNETSAGQQEIFYPGENFVIDETLIPWSGRLVFRQWIPNKAHKYGIKLFKLCSNEGKKWYGIDISVQMCSYATTLRKGVKWYRKLGIEYILGMCIVNAFVMYKAATKKQAKITWFRKEITACLPQTPGQHKKTYL
ncbi:hypothetical protein PR048_015401, partial [Dryococelus australis]